MRVLRDREANLLPHHLAPDDSLPAAVAQLADEVGEDVARQRLAELEFRPVFTAHPTEARRRAVSGAIRRIAELVAERDLRYIGRHVAGGERPPAARRDRHALAHRPAARGQAVGARRGPHRDQRVRGDARRRAAGRLPPPRRLAAGRRRRARRLRPCARSRGSGPGSAATATATRTSPPRSPRRPRRWPPSTPCWSSSPRPARPRTGSPSTRPARPAPPSSSALWQRQRGLSAAAGRADRGRRPQRAAPSGRLLPRRAHRGDADAQRRPRRTARPRSSRPTSPSCSARWPRPARRGRRTATCSGSSGRCRPSGSTWPSSRCGSTRRCTRARSRTSRRTASTAPWSRARSRCSTRSAPSAPSSAATACWRPVATSCRSRSPPSTSPPSTSWPRSRSPGSDAPIIDAIPLFETFADLEASRRHPRGRPRAPAGAAPARGERPPGRGHARLLGLVQGRRPGLRDAHAGHRAAPHHRVGAPQRHRAHAVPRPRRCARARWRPRQPCAARAAPGLGRRPVQAHRAGRGHLRPLRRPGDRRPAHRAGRRGDAAGRGALGRAPQRRGHRAVHARSPRSSTRSSRTRFHELVKAPGFPQWFAEVTPLEEVGLLPIGSRPARRGLSVESLDDLRAIPWVFSLVAGAHQPGRLVRPGHRAGGDRRPRRAARRPTRSGRCSPR